MKQHLPLPVVSSRVVFANVNAILAIRTSCRLIHSLDCFKKGKTVQCSPVGYFCRHHCCGLCAQAVKLSLLPAAYLIRCATSDHLTKQQRLQSTTPHCQHVETTLSLKVLIRPSNVSYVHRTYDTTYKGL